MTGEPLLELSHVSKSFREGARQRLIFGGIDLRVTRGERVALLGRSGSGKSTLLNLVAGIDYASSGEIRIEGRSISGMGERARTLFRRQRVGFVYQFFNLVPTLTVQENVALPLELNGARSRAAHEVALQMLERVGLDARAGAYPEELSGGEQQRSAIARALVHEPALILADEPTGNLDATTGRQVLSLLDELCVQHGVTVLTVTHSREVALRSDRALTLTASGIQAGLGEDTW